MTSADKNPLEGDALLRELQEKVGPYDGHTHGIISDGHETLRGHAVEVYYPKYDRARENLLLGLCIQHRLLANVGSDYHYDAHELVKGDHRLFADLLRLHRKELVIEGKEWWQ